MSTAKSIICFFCPAQSTKAYRRPRGGQSGREKKRDKSFQAPFLPARLTAPGSPRMRIPWVAILKWKQFVTKYSQWSLKKWFHLFLLISNLETVFYLPETLQSLTLETLQPIPIDLYYDHYQSSVNHEGLEKLLKLRIKTKLDRACIGISVEGLNNVPGLF